jgi:hypothetical protein
MQAVAGWTFPSAGACECASANFLEEQYYLDATECQRALRIELEDPSSVG